MATVHTGSRPPRAGTRGGALGSDAADIDARYGLEPVFEPGLDPRQLPMDAVIEVECPYCWQLHETGADLTLGDQQFIEDCQHCCHPIEFDVVINDEGLDITTQVRRADSS